MKKFFTNLKIAIYILQFGCMLLIFRISLCESPFDKKEFPIAFDRCLLT